MLVLNATLIYPARKSKFILHVLNRELKTLLYRNRAEPKSISVFYYRS